MKYSAQHYAEALFETLEDVSGERRRGALEGFLRTLRRNRDVGRLNQILRHYEKIYLLRKGMVKVKIETPESPSDGLKRSIEKAIGKPVVFTERRNPKLLAGVVITLNDAILIDASASTKLDSLLSNH